MNNINNQNCFFFFRRIPGLLFLCWWCFRNFFNPLRSSSFRFISAYTFVSPSKSPFPSTKAPLRSRPISGFMLNPRDFLCRFSAFALSSLSRKNSSIILTFLPVSPAMPSYTHYSPHLLISLFRVLNPSEWFLAHPFVDRPGYIEFSSMIFEVKRSSLFSSVSLVGELTDLLE